MSATNYRTWTNAPSHLYDTQTGANIPAPGWDGVITNGGTTAFSPDGKQHRVRPRGQGRRAHARVDGLRRRHQDVLEPRRPRDRPEQLPRLAGVHARRQVGRLPRGLERAQFETDSGAHGRRLLRRHRHARRSHRLDALDGYTGSGTDRTCPRTTRTSTSRRRCCPRPSAATSGSSSRATARTATPSRHAQGRRRPTSTASSGSPRSTSTPTAGHGREPPGLLPRRAGAARPTTSAASGCSRRASRTAARAARATSAATASAARRRRPARVRVPPPGAARTSTRACTTAADCCDTGDQCINNRCAATTPK